MATKKENPVVETDTTIVNESSEAVEAKIPEVKKVKIKLPVLRGQKDQSVFVCVNGAPYLIVRGQEVEVPENVYNVLKNSERALDEADAYIASVAN